MNDLKASCPLTLNQIVDEYFAESRNKLIELAAFFDRADRAADGANPTSDFRLEALKQATAILLEPGPQRVKQIMLQLSDPTEEPLARLDRKGALGAYKALDGAD
jgi:hypothetical protein